MFVRDKLKTLSSVLKPWRKLVYSGYAWERLFDKDVDTSWIMESKSY